MLRRIDINNLVAPSYTPGGKEIDLVAGSPRVSATLRTPGRGPTDSIWVRALKQEDLRFDLERRGYPSATEKGSQALMQQGVFVSLCSNAMAVCESGSEIRIVVAGTAFFFCLVGLHYRGSSTRLSDLNTYVQDTAALGLTNLNSEARRRLCVIMNSIVASLDDEKKLGQKYSEQPEHDTLLDCYNAYIYRGFPIPDELKAHCPALDRYTKHMVVLAIAVHRMLGGTFKQDKDTSFLGEMTTDDIGFGSATLLDRALIDYYDKVCLTYDNRPQGYEDADNYVRGGDRRSRDVLKSRELACFLAWIDANGLKNKSDAPATAATIRLHFDKHMSVPMPSVNDQTPPKNSAAATAADSDVTTRVSGGNSATAAPKLTPAMEEAKSSLNAFYNKHGITGENKSKLWGLLCKKRLTIRTGAAFDEDKVRECCDELKIALKD